MALVQKALVVAFAITALSAPTRADPEAEAALRLLANAQFDWDHYVEIESTENSFAGGVPYYSQVSVSDNLWLMRQRAEGCGWSRFGLIVRNGKAYFATLDDRPQLLGGQCTVCHANGPRALRGAMRHGMQTEIDRFNIQVGRVGLVRAYYPADDPAHDQTPLGLAPCSNCHDGVRRSRLARQNATTIRFQLHQHTMPPSGVLTDSARGILLEWAN